MAPILYTNPSYSAITRIGNIKTRIYLLQYLNPFVNTICCSLKWYYMYKTFVICSAHGFGRVHTLHTKTSLSDWELKSMLQLFDSSNMTSFKKNSALLT